MHERRMHVSLDFACFLFPAERPSAGSRRFSLQAGLICSACESGGMLSLELVAEHGAWVSRPVRSIRRYFNTTGVRGLPYLRDSQHVSAGWSWGPGRLAW